MHLQLGPYKAMCVMTAITTVTISLGDKEHLISLSQHLITKEKHMADHDNDFCLSVMIKKTLILHNNRFVIHGT